jgi:hypothetical protein
MTGLKMFDKAEPLYRELLQRSKQQFGTEHPRTAGALAQLGSNLLQQKKYPDAELILRESLAIREKKEPDAWTTFNTKSMLGCALMGQKNYAEAEPLLLQGYEGMKEREEKPRPGSNSKAPVVHAPDLPDKDASGLSKTGMLTPPARLIEAMERLLILYETTGKKEEAAKWSARTKEAKARKQ